jgi:hypothetical protein
MPLILPLFVLLGCAPLEVEVPAQAAAAKVDILEMAGVEPRKIAAWKEEYERFAKELDADGFALGYAQTMKDLQSEDDATRMRALKVCGASGDLRSIPRVVEQLLKGKRETRVWAGLALENVVSGYTLRRRDLSKGEGIWIAPKGKGDADLQPLRWIILEMFCSNDSNLQSYAATMTSYLNLSELEPVLRVVYKGQLPPHYPFAQHAPEEAKEDENRTK